MSKTPELPYDPSKSPFTNHMQQMQLSDMNAKVYGAKLDIQRKLYEQHKMDKDRGRQQAQDSEARKNARQDREQAQEDRNRKHQQEATEQYLKVQTFAEQVDQNHRTNENAKKTLAVSQQQAAAADKNANTARMQLGVNGLTGLAGLVAPGMTAISNVVRGK